MLAKRNGFPAHHILKFKPPGTGVFFTRIIISPGYVDPVTEHFSFDRANEAIDRLRSGQARYRIRSMC
jgi:hypothetical protein